MDNADDWLTRSQNNRHHRAGATNIKHICYQNSAPLNYHIYFHLLGELGVRRQKRAEKRVNGTPLGGALEAVCNYTYLMTIVLSFSHMLFAESKKHLSCL